MRVQGLAESVKRLGQDGPATTDRMIAPSKSFAVMSIKLLEFPCSIQNSGIAAALLEIAVILSDGWCMWLLHFMIFTEFVPHANHCPLVWLQIIIIDASE